MSGTQTVITSARKDLEERRSELHVFLAELSGQIDEVQEEIGILDGAIASLAQSNGATKPTRRVVQAKRKHRRRARGVVRSRIIDAMQGLYDHGYLTFNTSQVAKRAKLPNRGFNSTMMNMVKKGELVIEERGKGKRPTVWSLGNNWPPAE